MNKYIKGLIMLVVALLILGGASWFMFGEKSLELFFVAYLACSGALTAERLINDLSSK